MATLTRETVVAGALKLLDDVGLDKVSTRELARRLEVEQPSLYWHFRNKAELLHTMAAAAMEPHSRVALPQPGEDWAEWFRQNSRSFRRTLLLHRDGAKLHAGSRPEGESLDRALHKFDFLVAAGLPRAHAQGAMLTASWFTVGSVLEQQATPAEDASSVDLGSAVDHATMFETGLDLIVDGLALHRRTT